MNVKARFILAALPFCMSAHANSYGQVYTNGIYYTYADNSDAGYYPLPSHVDAPSEYAFNGGGNHIFAHSEGSPSGGSIYAYGETSYDPNRVFYGRGYAAITTASFYASVFAPTQLASVAIQASPTLLSSFGPYASEMVQMSVSYASGPFSGNSVWMYSCDETSCDGSAEGDRVLDTAYLYRVTLSARTVLSLSSGPSYSAFMTSSSATIGAIFGPWIPIDGKSSRFNDSILEAVDFSDASPATGFSFSPGWNAVSAISEPSITTLMVCGLGLLSSATVKDRRRRSVCPG